MDFDGCQACEGANKVTWMLTHLAPPHTIQACEQDVESAFIALLALRHNVDAGWLAKEFDDALGRAMAEAEVLEQEAAKPKRKPRAKPDPTIVPEEVLADDAVSEG